MLWPFMHRWRVLEIVPGFDFNESLKGLDRLQAYYNALNERKETQQTTKGIDFLKEGYGNYRAK